MKLKKENLFLGITIIICLVLFLERLTGVAIHIALGVLLTVLSVKHICKNANKMNHVTKKMRVVNYLLVGSLLVIVVSGMLLHPFQGNLLMKILHKLSGMVFCIGTIVHAVWYRRIRKGTN